MELRRTIARYFRPITLLLACLGLLYMSLNSSRNGHQNKIECQCQTHPSCPNETPPNLATGNLASAQPAAVPRVNTAAAGHKIVGIPKLLHYVFKDGQVFETYRQFIKSCLDQNPGWQVMLWSDDVSEKFIAEHYGQFIQKYRFYRDKLEKSDSVRYMILHKLGGVYLDMDVECRKPMSQLFSQSSVEESLVGINADAEAAAFLTEERREQTRILYGYSYCAMNSMMGARPGHPFFKLAINRMLGMPSLSHARLTTGPDFLTGVYRDWLKCARDGAIGTPDCQANEPVLLYPARLASPLMDTSLVNWETKCQPFFSKKSISRSRDDSERWKAIGCSQLVANGWNYDETDNATAAVHKFLHMGYGNHGQARTFNLFKEFPRIRTYYHG